MDEEKLKELQKEGLVPEDIENFHFYEKFNIFAYKKDTKHTLKYYDRYTIQDIILCEDVDKCWLTEDKYFYILNEKIKENRIEDKLNELNSIKYEIEQELINKLSEVSITSLFDIFKSVMIARGDVYIEYICSLNWSEETIKKCVDSQNCFLNLVKIQEL